MSYAFDHVHLQTTDLDATVAWFERLFDARRLWTGEFNGVGITRLGFHGAHVNVYHRPPANPGVTPDDAVIHHFALRPGDFDAAIADLKRRGARFHTEPAATGPLRVAFVEGPDNLRIEIIEGDLPEGAGLEQEG